MWRRTALITDCLVLSADTTAAAVAAFNGHFLFGCSGCTALSALSSADAAHSLTSSLVDENDSAVALPVLVAYLPYAR